MHGGDQPKCHAQTLLHNFSIHLIGVQIKVSEQEKVFTTLGHARCSMLPCKENFLGIPIRRATTKAGYRYEKAINVAEFAYICGKNGNTARSQIYRKWQ